MTIKVKINKINKIVLLILRKKIKSFYASLKWCWSYDFDIIGSKAF